MVSPWSLTCQIRLKLRAYNHRDTDVRRYSPSGVRYGLQYLEPYVEAYPNLATIEWVGGYGTSAGG